MKWVDGPKILVTIPVQLGIKQGKFCVGEGIEEGELFYRRGTYRKAKKGEANISWQRSKLRSISGSCAQADA
jgi:hypothetical protein